MRRIFITLLAAGLLLAGFFGAIRTARSQVETRPDGSQLLLRETDGDNVHEVWAPPEAEDLDAVEAINSFTTQTAYCYQPDAKKNDCYINWYYTSVDTAPDYTRNITTTIDGDIVARYRGFFQTSMYVSYAMAGPGYRVDCGALGSGGNPDMGESYSWSIQVNDATGAWMGNYGTAYCPAYIP